MFKIAMLVIFLTLVSCETTKVYYSYGGSPEKIVFRDDDKGPKIRMILLPDMILDPKLPQNLTAQIQFAADYQYYPRGLQFELYENGKLISLAPAEITVTTVIDDKVRYFKLNDNLNDIEGLIRKLRVEKNIPKESIYFSIAALIKAPLSTINCPKQIPMKLRVLTEGKVEEREFIYILGEREFSKPTNRPFG